MASAYRKNEEIDQNEFFIWREIQCFVKAFINMKLFHTKNDKYGIGTHTFKSFLIICWLSFYLILNIDFYLISLSTVHNNFRMIQKLKYSTFKYAVPKHLLFQAHRLQNLTTK